MNHVERFRAVMSLQPVDRLPVWEWAMWWDKTIDRWRKEGLPADVEGVFEIAEYLGMDPYKQFWFSTDKPTVEAEQHHVSSIVSDMDDYLRIAPGLYPDHEPAISSLAGWAKRQENGEAVVWMTLEGFFWFPRTLLGFSKLMLAYYDQPELIHQMNEDLLRFNLRLLEHINKYCVPTFITIAEDMSYNNGPMVSRQICDEFMSPCYRQMLERIKEMGALTIVDTDGDVTLLVPWMKSVGIDGVLPLERQAGVDGMSLRQQFPDLCMVGHYDKMIMHKGEEALRAEFERLLPLMKTGGFIPSVDHQTPPNVSFSEYQVYLRLLKEYAAT